MPQAILTDEMETTFLELYELFEADDPKECYETSVSKHIRCVPIRPDNKTEVKQPIFYPDRLLGYNISSNPGLIHVLRIVYAEVVKPVKYRVLLSDCNVFLRAMKVDMIMSSL